MGKFSSYRANELSLREERDRRICGYGYKYIDAIDKCVSYGGGADLPERPKAKGQKRSKTNVQPSDIQGNPAPQAAAPSAPKAFPDALNSVTDVLLTSSLHSVIICVTHPSNLENRQIVPKCIPNAIISPRI